LTLKKDVDGRNKSGHDDEKSWMAGTSPAMTMSKTWMAGKGPAMTLSFYTAASARRRRERCNSQTMTDTFRRFHTMPLRNAAR
jgi:hypothetical protein